MLMEYSRDGAEGLSMKGLLLDFSFDTGSVAGVEHLPCLLQA